MSVPFFSICKACRKYKTWASTIEEKEEEKKKQECRETYFTQSWQRAEQTAVNLSCTINWLPLESRVGKSFFSVPIYTISPHSPSPPVDLIADV